MPKRRAIHRGFQARMARDAMREADQAATIKKLHAKIGELTMERFFSRALGR